MTQELSVALVFWLIFALLSGRAPLVKLDDLAECPIRHFSMNSGKRDFGDLQQDRGNLAQTGIFALRSDKQGIKSFPFFRSSV